MGSYVSNDVRFADITTIGIGGSIAKFVESDSRVGIIEAVESADEAGIPLCVIGGGSNLLASDQPFDGVVVRDARQFIGVVDEVAPVEGRNKSVHLEADAGTNWDDLVSLSVDIGVRGIEAMSGIPGTVGASIVQNIGAYGQQVSDVVESVQVWDRVTKKVRILNRNELCFGYRSSLLKTSMRETLPHHTKPMGCSPRYIVLSVTLVLVHDSTSLVAYQQLANHLQVELGSRVPTQHIREAVLAVRASKGMLEDPLRYLKPIMSSTKRAANIEQALMAIKGETTDSLANRHSCGSFFVNPYVTVEQADYLPTDAPTYPVTAQSSETQLVKTSAAWLIEHAGFAPGFHLDGQPEVSLSNRHTLAITNRGNGTYEQVQALVDHISQGVKHAYGIDLIPEPVLVQV